MTTISRNQLLLVEDWEGLARVARFQPAILAQLCRVSLRQLERFFLLRFGQPPGIWMRELKCRLARELIARGWPNKAVFQELSFGNESHLCHEFQRFFGVSPQKFAPLQPSRAPAPAPLSFLPADGAKCGDLSRNRGQVTCRV